jgi:broad specificity phosphatase PhoE
VGGDPVTPSRRSEKVAFELISQRIRQIQTAKPKAARKNLPVGCSGFPLSVEVSFLAES